MGPKIIISVVLLALLASVSLFKGHCLLQFPCSRLNNGSRQLFLNFVKSRGQITNQACILKYLV